MTVQQLGTYNVTAQKYTRTSSSAPWTLTKVKIGPSKVMARNFIIAGLGDSNGSGEGNPPFFFPKCNRSETSYQFMAAYAVQQANQHASVTFLWPTCSGARILHIAEESYPGTNPNPGGANPLPPQIDQVAGRLALELGPEQPSHARSVDAVILSIGVNNLFFGPCVRYGLLYGPVLAPQMHIEFWPTELVPNTAPGASRGAMLYKFNNFSKTTLNQLITDLQDTLDGLYPPLAAAISSPLSSGGLGVPKENVIITNYPDFTHDEKGVTCDTYLNWKDVFDGNVYVPQWFQEDWAWFGLQTDLLNEHVVNTEATCGWQVAAVDNGPYGPFYHHGYCAGSFLELPSPFGGASVPSFSGSYFVGAAVAIYSGNYPGAFHPNNLGHQQTANVVFPLLCNALYGNPDCTGTPLPPK
jgi:hypothetical protein